MNSNSNNQPTGTTPTTTTATTTTSPVQPNMQAIWRSMIQEHFNSTGRFETVLISTKTNANGDVIGQYRTVWMPNN